jgi:preprotein translocase subunit SecB
VRLLRTQAAVHGAPKPAQGLSYDIEFEPAVDADPATASAFVVRVACRLRIQNQKTDDDVKENDPEDETQEESVATADFEYAALFDYTLREGEDGPTEEELTAYATTTGRFALYPFIREYVYDLTGRLALPPLTLEILSRPMPIPPELNAR